MALLKAKSNWFNNASDFDLLDDFFLTAQGLFLTQQSAGGGYSDVPAYTNSQINGIYYGTTSTGTSGASGLAGSISINLSGWNRISLAFRFILSALADGTNSYRVFLGFNSSTSANAGVTTRSAGFFYSNASANWQAYTYNSSTGTTTDTGIAASTSAFNTFLVRAKGTTSVEFLINNVLVATHTTNIPSAAVCPHFSILKTAGTTARDYYIDWARFSGSGNARTLDGSV
jgi:hypothetical protein